MRYNQKPLFSQEFMLLETIFHYQRTYGYEISKRISTDYDYIMSPGALHPLIDQCTEKGWISKEPLYKRRIYLSLTQNGILHIEEMVSKVFRILKRLKRNQKKGFDQSGAPPRRLQD